MPGRISQALKVGKISEVSLFFHFDYFLFGDVDCKFLHGKKYDYFSALFSLGVSC
jgi:hypothetical protein